MVTNTPVITQKAVIFLILLPSFGKSKLIPTTDEHKNKENSSKKDLKVASSYSYNSNTNGDGFNSFGYQPSFGLAHRSSSQFPYASRDFSFPSRYKVDRFGGGGSKFDVLSGGSRGSLIKNSYGENIGDVYDVSSLSNRNNYGPAVFETELDDDTDDFIDIHKDHEDKHHVEKADESSEDHEEADQKDNSEDYKVDKKFEVDEKSKNEQGDEAGRYDQSEGSNKAHEDEEKVYKGEEGSSDEVKGQHLSQSEGHKKGHKTTGFHNVYRKDEYKKDTTFYDDEHEDGQRELYDHEEQKHSRAEGEHSQAKKLDSAYEQADRAREGFFTNGHQYGLAQGHDTEELSKEHHEKELEHHKKDDHSSNALQEQAKSSSNSHR